MVCRGLCRDWNSSRKYKVRENLALPVPVCVRHACFLQETWSFTSTVILVPCSPWKLQHLQRQFSTAVLLGSSGLSGVRLSHCKFPRSAKLPFFHLILKYSWDAAHNTLMLSFDTVIMKKINKRNNLRSTYWQKEQQFLERLFSVCVAPRPCALCRNQLKIFLEKPLQCSRVWQNQSWFKSSTNKLSTVVW